MIGLDVAAGRVELRLGRRSRLPDQRVQSLVAGWVSGVVELIEVLEDDPTLVLGDARPRVPHLDAQVPAIASAAEQDAPLRRVPNRIGDEVLDDALQQTICVLCPSPEPRY